MSVCSSSHAPPLAAIFRRVKHALPLLALTLLSAIALPRVALGHEVAPSDAALADSFGRAFELSRFRGKPLVLFYEDRHTVELNRPFKKQLWEKGEALNLRKAAHVIAVANLQGYDFFPIRPIALSYVRDEEKRVGVPILVDLRGTLTSAPWRLPPKTSSVIVLDAEGRIRFQYSGKLPEKKVGEFYETLGSLVGVNLKG